METFGDLLGVLARGELSNLAVADEGQIREKDRLAMRDHANDGLLRLHSRFILSERDVVVEMFEHITNYHLLPRFSLNYEPKEGEHDEPIRYIFDLPEEPFEDTVIQVMAVYDSSGTRMPLNDDHSMWSVFTPQPKIIQVTRPLIGHSLSVHYRSSHPKLTGDLDQIIDLPDSLFNALTAYVAFKVFTNIGTEGSTIKAQQHYSAYGTLCAEVDQMDLVSNTTSTTNERFNRGGWI